MFIIENAKTSEKRETIIFFSTHGQILGQFGEFPLHISATVPPPTQL